jgi:hypothetical protein
MSIAFSDSSIDDVANHHLGSGDMPSSSGREIRRSPSDLQTENPKTAYATASPYSCTSKVDTINLRNGTEKSRARNRASRSVPQFNRTRSLWGLFNIMRRPTSDCYENYPQRVPVHQVCQFSSSSAGAVQPDRNPGAFRHQRERGSVTSAPARPANHLAFTTALTKQPPSAVLLNFNAPRPPI